MQRVGIQLTELGNRIRGERSRRNLSLAELARTRISRSVVSAVERGTLRLTRDGRFPRPGFGEALGMETIDSER